MARVVTAAQRAELAAVHRRVSGVSASGVAAGERTLPVADAFRQLFPQGVQRGSVVGCHGPAAVTLGLALVAGAAQEGAWVGVAGLPALGLGAAAELGVPLERLVHVVEPPPEVQWWDDTRWGEVLAALVDGFDVVLLGPEVGRVRPATARRVAARLQARGAIAVCIDLPAFVADIRIETARHTWHGLGDGHGVARGRAAEVVVDGRRVPRPRRAHLHLPGEHGRIESMPEVANPGPQVAVPLRRTG